MRNFHICIFRLLKDLFIYNIENSSIQMIIKSKKISNAKSCNNDQEPIQSDPTSCPQNQKENNKIHKLTAVYKRHPR